MFIQLIFVVFISIMAIAYRRNSVCYEIKKPGENNYGHVTIDCDKNKSNQTAPQGENWLEIKICRHMQDSSDKCYYTQYYTDLMNKFLEGQNKTPKAKARVAKAKIRDQAKIEKYGLVLCNLGKNHSDWPQFEYSGQQKDHERIFRIQCKNGHLLDNNGTYDVHKSLCTLMGYNDNYKCPEYLWHYVKYFAYFCKLS